MANVAAFASVVEKIHASPLRSYIVTTGAGGTAIAALMSVPGCSKTLLNANVPYHMSTTTRILDTMPESFLSPVVGRQLSQYAFEDSVKLVGTRNDIVGIGATAAIATDRTRKGQDAVFVSAWQKDIVRSYSLVMTKGRARSEQEQLVSAVIIKAIADAASVPYELDMAGEEGTLEVTEYPLTGSPISMLIRGEIPCALFNANGDTRLNVAPYTTEEYTKQPDDVIQLLYPGSFKPLHWGHTELARVAGEVMQRYRGNKRVVITYEISASIVGKRDVNEDDFRERLQPFLESNRRVAITTAKLFIDKAKMFPNHGLIVGVDTARRVIDPQYYDNSEEKMIAAIQQIGSYGCYFVVGGRKLGDDEWDDMSNMKIPSQIENLFKAIQQNDFRVDISSTEIRARKSSMSGTPNNGDFK